MITDMEDERFFEILARLERSTSRLLRDPHYGPIIRSDGSLAELEEMRVEGREREERARARKLRAEASFAEG